MRITKLQRAKDYRIFRDFSWPADLPAFARFNVVYGWNGSGKTSLSSLFRQIQLKKSVTEGLIEIQVGETRVAGSDFPTAALPQVRVFNRDTVDLSVFEVGGKQFPPVFFLGEDSVQKQREIEELKKRLSDTVAHISRSSRKKQEAEASLDAFCSEEAKGIKNLLTVAGGGPHNNYNAASFRTAAQRLSGLDVPPAPMSETDRQRHIAIKDGKPMSTIAPPSANFPNFVELVKSTDEMLSRSVVSSVINELAENALLANWVSRGLDLHTEGETKAEFCHFCTQPLPARRVEQLEAHFNNEFKRFQTEIGELINKVESAKKAVDILKLPPKELLYEHLRADYEKAITSLRSQSATVMIALDVLSRSLAAKRDEPFRSLELRTFITNYRAPDSVPERLETFFQAVFGGLAAMGAIAGHTAFKQACSLIEVHNANTAKFDATLKEARAALAEAEVMRGLTDWKTRVETIEQLSNELKLQTTAANEVQRQIGNLEREIREHQRPADELNEEIAAYLGRDEIKFATEQNGYRITRGGEPAINLSEGERTAIALLYFLKSLKGTDFDIGNGIVVIDDPVSSLDANSLFSAFAFMKHRTNNAGQLFILTHNFAFFRQVRNWLHHLPGQQSPRIDKRQAHFYMLNTEVSDGLRSASLCPLDPFLYQYESEYHYLFKRVFSEVKRVGSGGLEAHYSIPNMARRLLESFLAFKVPHKPGELFQKLDAVPYDPAAKTRILRFLHTYSHFDQVVEPDHDVSVLSEARPVLQELLGLMESLDPAHYQAMVALAHPATAEELLG